MMETLASLSKLIQNISVPEILGRCHCRCVAFHKDTIKSQPYFLWPACQKNEMEEKVNEQHAFRNFFCNILRSIIPEINGYWTFHTQWLYIQNDVQIISETLKWQIFNNISNCVRGITYSQFF